MQTCRVICCEKTGRWAFALRSVVPAAQSVLCETRTLAECAARLQESPASLVVVEATSENWPQVCRWLSLQTDQFAQMRAVVVGSSSAGAAEAVLRTAGAHHVVDSIAGLGRLTRWISRHIRQVPHSQPSARQWVWARMPWPPRESTKRQP